MIFDPFGDFNTQGYLRNSQGLTDLAEVKRLEHRHFTKNLGEAVEHLRQVETISYQDVLDTHKILFQKVYPWAGQDRATTAPGLAIGKADRIDFFAPPGYVQNAVHFALKLGQDHTVMAQRPGEVMGYLAHAHPFLDGNGRALMVVHNELAYRAGISIDWVKTDRDAYLEALTRELDRPGQGELDNYLKPFIGPAVSHEQATATLAQVRGLGGNSSTQPDRDQDAAQTEEVVRQRRQQEDNARDPTATIENKTEREAKGADGPATKGELTEKKATKDAVVRERSEEQANRQAPSREFGGDGDNEQGNEHEGDRSRGR